MGVCVLQVTLAYESIVLYMCEGKVLMDMAILLNRFVLISININDSTII